MQSHSDEELIEYRILEKPYICIFCEKAFSTKATLITHSRIHTGERPFKCNYCEKAFIQKGHLIVHERLHTGDKPFQCSVCNKSLGDGTSLVRHMRIHTGEKPFKCKQCGKAFNQKIHLVNHTRIHTGEKTYQCSFCEKVLSDGTALIRHERIHTGEKPYKCPLCDKCFAQKGNLNSHMQNRHMSSYNDVIPHELDKVDKPFPQKSTHRVYVETHHTNDHTQNHSPERESKYLHEHSDENISIDRHRIPKTQLIIQPRKRMYRCTYCNKGFLKKSDLNNHIKKHTMDGPYACNECDMVFSHNSDRITHMTDDSHW